MNEPTSPDRGTPLDDDAIARLIEDAGPRPPIAREDLDAIAIAARAAWQARGSDEAGAERRPAPTDRRWTASGSRPRVAVVLALAAALAALVIGLRAWRAAVDDGTPTAAATPVVVATVAAGSGSLRVESAGVERPLAVGDAVPSGAVVRTAAGSATSASPQSGRGALRLEGGAVLRIDNDTAARLVSSSRIDLLAGAIYADTDPDGAAVATGEESRALEVHTVAGIARDVGTRFMTRITGEPEAAALQVLVRAGAVVVEHAGESETAHGGEQIVARPGRTIERRATPTYGPDWAWVIDAAPPFEVAGRSAAAILEWVARETGWEVRYEDAALAEAARGMIQQSSRAETGALRPDQAPFDLLPGFNLEGRLEAGVLTVERR